MIKQELTKALITKDLLENLAEGVELLDSEKLKLSLHAEHLNAAMQVQFDWFLTLTFRSKKNSVDEVATFVRKLFDLLSAQVHGSRSKKRIIHFCSIERHSDQSLHVHALIKNPEGKSVDLQKLIHEKWKSLTTTDLNTASFDKKNPEWFKPIESGKQLALLKYITKQSYRHEDGILVDLQCLNGSK